jgi:hypothetical protein
MFCEDSQTLSPNEWSTDCDPSLYIWEIVGAGYFSEFGDGDYTRTYNAPDCGVDCANKATINLYCDSALPVDSIDITFYPCPKNASITYTTQQMQVNESQTLGIDKGDGQCGTDANWFWELSGGGTLSDPTSPTSCTYTAPATNANCELNPTITLSCDGVVMDSLSIAVNAAGSGSAAYYKNVWVSGGVPSCPSSNETCLHAGASYLPTYIFRYYEREYFYCDDVSVGEPTCAGKICGDESCICPDCGVIMAGECSDAIRNHTEIDNRTPTQKANGCCPAGLL